MAPGVCELDLSRFTLSKTRNYGSTEVNCQDWSPDGQYMCLGQFSSHQIFSLQSLGNPWELNEQVSFGVFDVKTATDVIDNIDGISYGNSGNQIWVSGHTGLNTGKIISYSLTLPYRFDGTGNAPTRLDSFATSAGGAIKIYSDFNIKPDGTRTLGWGNDGGPHLFEFDMSAFDITTMAYNSGLSTTITRSAFVPPSGNCVYVDGGSGVINKYEFGTAWDATTVGSTITDSIDISIEIPGSIESIFITDNRMFVLDSNDNHFQYDA